MKGLPFLVFISLSFLILLLSGVGVAENTEDNGFQPPFHYRISAGGEETELLATMPALAKHSPEDWILVTIRGGYLARKDKSGLTFFPVWIEDGGVAGMDWHPSGEYALKAHLLHIAK